ncbi:MAG: tail completion protein gp17 [Armatimonadota bacterium]
MPTAAQKSPLQPLTAAVYGRLYQAITVNGAVVPILRAAHEKQAFPYLTFGPATSTEDGHATSYAREYMVPVDAWSRRDDLQAQEMTGQATTLLIDPENPLDLSADGFNVTEITLEDDDDPELDADGRTWHAHQLYRVRIQQL